MAVRSRKTNRDARAVTPEHRPDAPDAANRCSCGLAHCAGCGEVWPCRQQWEAQFAAYQAELNRQLEQAYRWGPGTDLGMERGTGS